MHPRGAISGPHCWKARGAHGNAKRREKVLCRSATHVVRSGMDECFVTGGAVRRLVLCRTYVGSDARATLHGVPFPSATHPEELRFRRLSFAYFSLARTPRRKSPWGTKKSRGRPAQGQRK